MPACNSSCRGVFTVLLVLGGLSPLHEWKMPCSVAYRCAEMKMGSKCSIHTDVRPSSSVDRHKQCSHNSLGTSARGSQGSIRSGPLEPETLLKSFDCRSQPVNLDSDASRFGRFIKKTGLPGAPLLETDLHPNVDAEQQ